MPPRPCINDHEGGKQIKIRREKPYVYKKMMAFTDKVNRGESIAIIQFQWDYACNFRCKHCSINNQQGVSSRRRMTLEDAADLSRQADELGLARFVITGGEPLVFPDLFSLIREINPQKHYINMDTNGWYLTVDMAASLKEAGVDRIQLSIDSLDPKAHDLFRGKPGAHLRAVRAADAAVAAGMDLFIQTVVTRSRLYSVEFKAFLEHWNLKGVGVFVTYIKPTGAGEALRDEMVGWEDMEYMRELERTYDVFTHLTPAYGRAGGCISVRGMVSVTPYGDVLPCPYHYTPIGNLFDDSLERILERGMSTPPFNNRIQPCWIADKDYKYE